jgi:hypothetical protein
MNNFMKRLLVSAGAMVTMATVSSTVVFAASTTPHTTAQPWNAGQVVDIWAKPPGFRTHEGLFYGFV